MNLQFEAVTAEPSSKIVKEIEWKQEENQIVTKFLFLEDKNGNKTIINLSALDKIKLS